MVLEIHPTFCAALKECWNHVDSEMLMKIEINTKVQAMVKANGGNRKY